jgi:hypothetical protein
MAKLTSCQLESYRSVTEWISDQNNIINDLAVCDIMIENSSRKFYIMSNPPHTQEWRTFPSTLALTEKADTELSIVTHLLSCEARLSRARGLSPHAAWFIQRGVQGQQSNRGNGNDRHGDDRQGDYWKSQVISHGGGVKGHIKAKCRSKHIWALYEKSRTNATLATSTSIAESESFLFSVIHSDSIPDSVITDNVPTTNRSANCEFLVNAATNHVTSNRHLIETFHPMANREHLVKTANNSIVNAEGCGAITCMSTGQIWSLRRLSYSMFFMCQPAVRIISSVSSR